MARLDALGVVVKDMARAIRFIQVLGLDVPNTPGEDHVELKLDSGIRLMLDAQSMVTGFMPDWVEPRGNGRVGLALLCSSPADVDAHVEKARAAGFKVAKEPWDAFWGQRYATVHSDDGVSVDLFAPLPVKAP